MVSEEALKFLTYLQANHGSMDKALLVSHAQARFNFTQDRSLFYTPSFAVRFSSSQTTSFSNTVLSLSNLQKIDEIPFFVCLVTPNENRVYLANSTFLSKISHSSHLLREDNIRGSFNGSDIMKQFNGLANKPENFQDLFAIHAEIGFEGNLARLVEATTGIIPSGTKLVITANNREAILLAPARAAAFVHSEEYLQVKSELDERVGLYASEIMIAGLIDNVNIRGRIIEYLIAGEDESLRHSLVKELQHGKRLSRFQTKNTLGDYIRIFDNYSTATDVKTKIMVLKSNPKAYNLDKLLEFLSTDKSVCMFYFVGLEPSEIVGQSLISIFQTDLLANTILLKHWAGRNSRGVAQFEGRTVQNLILNPRNDIDIPASQRYLDNLIDLV